MSYRSAVTFMPSSASYGGEEELTKKQNDIAEYVPALKAFLGIDDAAKRVAQIKTRLAILDGGGPAAFAQAKAVCGLCSVSVAKVKLAQELETAEAEAFKSRTRDTLYTGLAVTGVLVGTLTAIYLGSKVWSEVQQGKKVQAETKRLSGS